jgi:hypothetical protein
MESETMLETIRMWVNKMWIKMALALVYEE